MKKSKIVSLTGKQIAKLLVKSIKASGLTQAFVFGKCGLQRMNVYAWKTGRAEPNMKSIRKVEHALRICQKGKT